MAQLTITLTIPDAELTRVRDTILRALPIPDRDEDGQPDMTFAQWVTVSTRAYWRGVYKRGVKILRDEGSSDDSGSIIG